MWKFLLVNPYNFKKDGLQCSPKKNKITGMLKLNGWAHQSEWWAKVISHVDSFPVIKCCYCRAKTNKTYLEAGLTIQKMYDLYKKKCIRENKPWGKSTYYLYIFNTCCNIDFHIPKRDQCEKCEEIKIKVFLYQ